MTNAMPGEERSPWAVGAGGSYSFCPLLGPGLSALVTSSTWPIVPTLLRPHCLRQEGTDSVSTVGLLKPGLIDKGRTEVPTVTATRYAHL